jgi:hypothetical protein
VPSDSKEELASKVSVIIRAVLNKRNCKVVATSTKESKIIVMMIIIN